MDSTKQTKFTPTLATLIWFGAAVSVTEIMVGTLFAPLGWQKGLLAIVLGHILGGSLFFAAGLIGARTGKSAMQTVQLPFGQKGGKLFASLNVVQLLGWTAIMIFVGAEVASHLTYNQWGDNSFVIWCLIIGCLIVLWVYMGFWRYFKLVNIPIIMLLFVTCFWISHNILTTDITRTSQDIAPITFVQAVELAIAMPLSWLPLVADYTRFSSRPIKATLSASFAYGIGSSWMYAIGLGAALFTAETNVASILRYVGPGAAPLVAIVLATVTTTFLDAYSGGVSAKSVVSKLPEKHTAAVITILGVILAITLPVNEMEPFLLFIGAVFVPMIAVQIADFFVFKNKRERPGIYWPNMVVWLIGFCIYQVLTYVYTLPIITSLSVAIITFALTCLARLFFKGKEHLI